MTLSFIQAGRFVAYAPIRFVERTGKSKVKAVRDILRTLQIMTQMMIYYNPMKLAVAASAAVLAAALVVFAFVQYFAGPWLSLPVTAIPRRARGHRVLLRPRGARLHPRLHFEAQKGPVSLD